MPKKILLGLTTTPGSDWREKIREIDKYAIKEIALFPTFLQLKERKELYAELTKTKLTRIPHVHLRDDMGKGEVDFLAEKYQTKLFNIHSRKNDYLSLERLSEYKKKIFVENGSLVDEQFVDLAKQCGGFCFDVSHYHDFAVVQNQTDYRKLIDLFRQIKIGCCHISAMVDRVSFAKSLRTGKMVKTYCSHYLNNLKELDYVREYVSYLPEFVSIELENSFREQLEIKKYLEKIIG